MAQAKWNHFEFQIGRLESLDRAAKRIGLAATLDEAGHELVPARSLDYDTLVIAIGSRTNDFGTPGVAEHCILLDTTAQANGYLRSGQNYCGYPNDNKDFFKVYLFTGGTITADLTNHTGDGVRRKLARDRPPSAA